MSTFRTPVGPQPSKVYWRRRLLVILGIVAVIIIVVLILVRPGTAKPKAIHTPLPSASVPHTPAAPAACKKSDVTVQAQTDAVTYAAGVQPMLSLVITNTGSVACTMSVGTDVQQYVITSGTEKIWSSKDCQTNPVAASQLLQPGTPVKSTPFAWDRTRSDPSTCKTKNRPQVIAKGASYHLNATVDGDTSATSRQFVLK